MQAGFLRIRLKYLDELAREKRDICEKYLNRMYNERIILPMIREGATHIWHQRVSTAIWSSLVTIAPASPNAPRFLDG